ncbi:MAG: hypothetical protein EA408_13820 [Marinilabiliales bacterium]|nr:MAG: hypothetical protein EA408_13820 [Marinilabiliales bacterium]
MPRIAASIVFPVSSPPRRNAVVEVDGDGTVVSVSRGSPGFDEIAGVQYYSGILVPGLVDVMCGEKVDGDWLLTRGVRVAGTTVAPERNLWQGRYGGCVSYAVYSDMNSFEKLFRQGSGTGVLLWGEPGLPVLAGYGRMDLLQVMTGLQQFRREYELTELISMATLNGALATGFDGEAGTIEPGKRSGLNIIEGADLQRMRLLQGSRLRRIC